MSGGHESQRDKDSMKQTNRVLLSVMTAGSLLILCIVIFYRVMVPYAHATGAGDAQNNSSAQANGKGCSLKTMQGTHGYSYSGTVLGSPIAAAGPITFDGEG